MHKIPIIILLVLTLPAAGKVIYVDDDATGTNDGSSWQNAYRYLQDALKDANLAEKPLEIRVAQGAYKPDQGANQTPDDRTATFQLINGVTLKGGYAGFGELDPNARDIEEYDTILSGDLAGNDIEVNIPCDLVDEPSRDENSYHVVTMTGSGTYDTSVLDGFTITGGNANGGAYGTENGAGIFNFNYDGWPTMSNCNFSRNSAVGNGGGIYSSIMYSWSSRGSPTLINCTFNRNWAGRGGGMYNWNGSPKLTSCTFIRNWANEGGGGGICNSNSNLSLTNCTFDRNWAGEGGGGGICNIGSRTELINCTLTGNSTEGNGGGICNYAEGTTSLTNCTITNNRANEYGGGIHCNSVIATFTNCILWGNSASIGDEIAVLGGEGHASCPMVSVFYCNVQGGQLRAYVNIAHECHEYMDYGLRWVNGNIDAAPCFAALGYWDTNGTSDEPNDDLWVDGDYHLKSQAGRWDTNPPSGDWVQDDVTSPCIDAGDPMSPIGLEPFPNGGRVNMGAYGGTAEASKSYFGKPPCETIIAGDINGDCKVDFKDIQLIALNWLEESQHGRR